MSAKRICLIALLIATLTGGKLAIPVANIEIVTLLLVVYALTFGWRDSFIACLVFISIEPLIHGFQPWWIVLYFSYWPALVTVVAFLPKRLKRARIVIAIAIGIIFTVLFGLLDALIYTLFSGGLGSGNFWGFFAVYYLKGFIPPWPFVPVQIISNAVILPLLVPTLYKALSALSAAYNKNTKMKPSMPVHSEEPALTNNEQKTN